MIVFSFLFFNSMLRNVQCKEVYFFISLFLCHLLRALFLFNYFMVYFVNSFSLFVFSCLTYKRVCIYSNTFFLVLILYTNLGNILMLYFLSTFSGSCSEHLLTSAMGNFRQTSLLLTIGKC